MQKITILVAFILTISIFLTNCAQPGMPTGGSKDTIAPELLKAKPLNYSTNSQEKNIHLFFNELVVLKDLNQNLLIYPLLKNRPKIDIAPKEVFIKISSQDTLLENTTYVFNFGNAIVDHHEGNPIPDFTYAFSTGNSIDSLVVEGKIIHALNQTPVEKTLLFLYQHPLPDSLNIDSLPYLKKPDALGRSNKNGYFYIEHLAAKNYSLFAVADKNNNWKLDVDESMAFLDSLIFPIPAKTKLDTIKIKPKIEKNKKGSLSTTDSLQIRSIRDTNIQVTLRFFEPVPKQFKINKTTSENYKKAILEFNQMSEHTPHVFWLKNKDSIVKINFPKDSLVTEIPKNKKDTSLLPKISIVKKDSFSFVSTDTILLEQLIKMDWSKNHDKLTIYLLPPFEPEQLNLAFSIDSNKTDTQRITFANRKDFKKETTTNYSTNLNNNTLDLGNVLEVKFKHLPIKIDTQKIKLQDSLGKNLDFLWNQKENESNIYTINHPFKEKTKYKICTDSAFFEDIFQLGNLTNDTLIFTTKENKNYGSLKLNIKNLVETDHYIIQLNDPNKKITIREKYVSGKETKIIWEFLTAGSYEIKLIEDKNNNKKWDTGNFNTKQQPEKIIIHPKKIEIKENWDTEEDWEPNL